MICKSRKSSKSIIKRAKYRDLSVASYQLLADAEDSGK